MSDPLAGGSWRQQEDAPPILPSLGRPPSEEPRLPACMPAAQAHTEASAIHVAPRIEKNSAWLQEQTPHQNGRAAETPETVRLRTVVAERSNISSSSQTNEPTIATYSRPKPIDLPIEVDDDNNDPSTPLSETRNAPSIQPNTSVDDGLSRPRGDLVGDINAPKPLRKVCRAPLPTPNHPVINPIIEPGDPDILEIGSRSIEVDEGYCEETDDMAWMVDVRQRYPVRNPTSHRQFPRIEFTPAKDASYTCRPLVKTKPRMRRRKGPSTSSSQPRPA